jgi:hypothetical protein
MVEQYASAPVQPICVSVVRKQPVRGGLRRGVRGTGAEYGARSLAARPPGFAKHSLDPVLYANGPVANAAA